MTQYVNDLGSIQPDVFILGREVPPLTTSVTIKQGQGVLSRGALLGKVGFKPGNVTPGTNTGTGTVTGLVVGGSAQFGEYTLTCITATANGGTFLVFTPDGTRLADAVVGTEYELTGHIGFTITDGGTDFAVGDSFTVAVDADNEYKLVDASTPDGSAVASLVLAEESVDTTTAAVTVVAYKQGIFNKAALSVASGDTVDAHADELRLVNIFYKAEF